MAKLYPPYIEGNIVAQSGKELVIPFRFNRAMSEADLSKSKKRAQIRLKTVTSNTWLDEYSQVTPVVEIDSNNHTQGVVKIPVLYSSDHPKVGMHYKVQIAFISDTDEGELEVGHYSSIGVFKYTTKPELSFANLTNTGVNSAVYTYIGQYNQANGDKTEKIYSYEFQFQNGDTGEIVESSGELLHDSRLDDISYKTLDSYNLKVTLEENIKYNVIYKVTTQNGIQASIKQQIVSYEKFPNPLSANKLVATNDFENGRIHLRLDKTSYFKDIKQVDYIITRACSKDNYTLWEEVLKLTVDKDLPVPQYLLTDYTVEQGYNYQYAIQMIDKDIRSEKLKSNVVECDFEDILLYDGQRQLRIKFNPKISSYKQTVLEGKLDTIGGQYPLYYRNGKAKYYEFPISGLISLQMDTNEAFMTRKELGYEYEETIVSGKRPHRLPKVPNQDLEVLNYRAERIFRQTVLEWLNNGKYKLFRSPQEGNKIVRLMNISLTPNDVTGRLISSFNSQAYEACEVNYENLTLYGFIEGVRIYNNEDIEKENSRYVTHTFAVQDMLADGNDSASFIESGGAYYLEIRNAIPGTRYELTYYSDNSTYEIMIGSTGTYIYPALGTKIKSLRYIDVQTPVDETCSVIYSVLTTKKQHIVSPIKGYVWSNNLYQWTGETGIDNLINNLQDYLGNYNDTDFYKRKVARIYTMKLSARQVVEAYEYKGVIYYDHNFMYPVDKMRDTIYKLLDGSYVDGFTLNPINIDENSFAYEIDNFGKSWLRLEPKSPNDIQNNGPEEVNIDDLDMINKLKLGNGVIAELWYQELQTNYYIENNMTIPASYNEVEWNIYIQKLRVALANEFIIEGE